MTRQGCPGCVSTDRESNTFRCPHPLPSAILARLDSLLTVRPCFQGFSGYVLYVLT